MRFKVCSFVFVFVVGLGLGLAGCDDSVCTRNSDCKSPLICGTVNTCVQPPDMSELDGGEHDASSDSSAAVDLSGEDQAHTDAQAVDASDVD